MESKRGGRNMLGKLAPKLGRPPKKKRANQRKTVMLKCQECGKYAKTPRAQEGVEET